MVQPPTPVSRAPLKRLEVCRNSANTAYSPGSQVKSNLTVTVEKEWSAEVNHDILVLRFEHGPLSLQSIKLDSQLHRRALGEERVSVDREAKLLCLDSSNGINKTLAYFEDTRDFVVTVAVFQKTGIPVQVSSVEKLTRPASAPVKPQAEGTRGPTVPGNVRPLHSNSPGISIQHLRQSIQQLPTSDYGYPSQPSVGSSPSPVLIRPRSREDSPWQAYLNNKGGQIHAPRVSSPLRASVPLATPVSMYARGRSAGSHFGAGAIPNLYRTVSVPVAEANTWHGSVTTEKDAQTISQPSRSCVPRSTTPRISEDSDNASQSSQASSRLTNYKDQMPKPRTLPFSPEVKRQKRARSKASSDHAAVPQTPLERQTKKKPNEATRTTSYADQGINCNLSEILKPKVIDAATNTSPPISKVCHAATQTISQRPSDATHFLVVDLNVIEDGQNQISRLVEQYKVDTEAGRHASLYAEYYASQLDSVWENMCYSQPFK